MSMRASGMFEVSWTRGEPCAAAWFVGRGSAGSSLWVPPGRDGARIASTWIHEEPPLAESVSVRQPSIPEDPDLKQGRGVPFHRSHAEP